MGQVENVAGSHEREYLSVCMREGQVPLSARPGKST